MISIQISVSHIWLVRYQDRFRPQHRCITHLKLTHVHYLGSRRRKCLGRKDDLSGKTDCRPIVTLHMQACLHTCRPVFIHLGLSSYCTNRPVNCICRSVFILYKQACLNYIFRPVFTLYIQVRTIHPDMSSYCNMLVCLYIVHVGLSFTNVHLGLSPYCTYRPVFKLQACLHIVHVSLSSYKERAYLLACCQAIPSWMVPDFRVGLSEKRDTSQLKSCPVIFN